ncbi:MAG: hypothetical protein OEW12_07910, partial [Deltaproteobacteria bacterium]|nr:hypothetical protein [Deltaproteobacteria bacterium]
ALCRHPGLVRVVAMGQTSRRMVDQLEQTALRLKRAAPPCRLASGLEEAFGLALEALPGGGVLLFSPACASFDMFPNYKVRGERFRDLVRRHASALQG